MKKMRTERESTIKRLLHPITSQTNKTLIGGGSDRPNAASKSALLLNVCPDKEDIKDITEELQAAIHPDKLERTIELAEELKDESEEETINQTLPLENGVTYILNGACRVFLSTVFSLLF